MPAQISRFDLEAPNNARWQERAASTDGWVDASTNPMAVYLGLQTYLLEFMRAAGVDRVWSYPAGSNHVGKIVHPDHPLPPAGSVRFDRDGALGQSTLAMLWYALDGDARASVLNDLRNHVISRKTMESIIGLLRNHQQVQIAVGSVMPPYGRAIATLRLDGPAPSPPTAAPNCAARYDAYVADYNRTVSEAPRIAGTPAPLHYDGFAARHPECASWASAQRDAELAKRGKASTPATPTPDAPPPATDCAALFDAWNQAHLVYEAPRRPRRPDEPPERPDTSKYVDFVRVHPTCAAWAEAQKSLIEIRWQLAVTEWRNGQAGTSPAPDTLTVVAPQTAAAEPKKTPVWLYVAGAAVVVGVGYLLLRPAPPKVEVGMFPRR